VCPATLILILAGAGHQQVRSLHWVKGAPAQVELEPPAGSSESEIVDGEFATASSEGWDPGLSEPLPSESRINAYSRRSILLPNGPIAAGVGNSGVVGCVTVLVGSMNELKGWRGLMEIFAASVGLQGKVRNGLLVGEPVGLDSGW
jgi:hypothetical protein